MPNEVGYDKLEYISPKGGKRSTHQNEIIKLSIPTHAQLQRHRLKFI